MMGIVTKMTVDVDGAGSNAGWLDEGVWIAYNINVVNAGAFRVNYRVSSKDGGGAFRISLFDTDGEVVGAIPSLPATGNWQSWATISDHITLPAGKCVLVITSEAAGWNISSLELSRKA